MPPAWDLTLSIDARGHDDTHVTTSPAGGDGARQLIVRIGTVTVHCLDGASAMSAGLAWATARLQARTWLPDLDDHPEPWATSPTSARAAAGYGAAYPAGSILLDGRQRWQVTPRAMTLAVTVGPLTVTVHDWTALDTHIRAWTEASAVATRLFPGKSLPFSTLINQARRGICRDWDDKVERRANSERKPSRHDDTQLDQPDGARRDPRPEPDSGPRPDRRPNRLPDRQRDDRPDDRREPRGPREDGGR